MGTQKGTANMGNMTVQQMQAAMEALMAIIASDAVAHFDDTISPVRRVAVKVNPAVVGQFLAMAILRNGQRFEACIQADKRQIVWCEMPNCNCMGFVRTRSPFEGGVTIED